MGSDSPVHCPPGGPEMSTAPPRVTVAGPISGSGRGLPRAPSTGEERNIAYAAPSLKCLNIEATMKSLSTATKRVYVDPYYRVRNGVIQHVRGHWRRWPQRRGSATVISFPHPSAA